MRFFFFNISLFVVHTLFPLVLQCLDPIGQKKLPVIDMTLSYEFFNPYSDSHIRM